MQKKVISRYFYIFIIMTVIGAIILLKAMSIMFFERNYWNVVKSSYVGDTVVIEPKRGNLLSCDGELMVSSMPQYMLYMDFVCSDRDAKRRRAAQEKRNKLLRENMQEICEGLHRILPDMSVAEFRRKFETGMKRRSRYWRIYPRRVSYAEYKAIKQLPVLRESANKGGFFVEKNIQRKKIYGSLAQRTLGDLYAAKDSAKNGLELAFDKELRGKAGLGHKKKVQDEYLVMVDEPAVDGSDIMTTLNVEIQDIAEEALLEMLHHINEKGGNARTGVVVVMEVKTGDIKAIVNMNRMGDGNYYETKNNALTDILEPGSTFKTASMMVALEDRKIQITDSVDANGGQYRFYGTNMKDHNWNRPSAYHMLSVPQVLMFSSNIGIARIIDENYHKTPEKYVEGLHRMGLATPLNLLPGSGIPVIRYPNKDNWYNTALPWMAMGYETQIPPINIVAFYNAIANDGCFVKPRLVKSIWRDGNKVKEFDTEVINPKICSQHTLDDITKILTMVVNDPTGLGRKAKSERFLIAGKTGTAQISDGSSTAGGGHQLSFCGFYPVGNPKYTCIVSIQTKGGIISGGGTSGVVFGKIAERIMAKELAMDISENVDSTAVFIPTVRKGNIRDARVVLEEFDIDYDEDMSSSRSGLPIWGVAENTDKRVVLTEDETDKWNNLVPNVVGMGAKDALYLLETRGMKVHISGFGRVRQQSIMPGTSIRKGQYIDLTLR